MSTEELYHTFRSDLDAQKISMDIDNHYLEKGYTGMLDIDQEILMDNYLVRDLNGDVFVDYIENLN